MKQQYVFGSFVVLFFFLMTGSTSAQYVFPRPTPTPSPSPSPSPTATPIPCPRVRVQAQSRGRVRDGDRVGFIVNIAGGDPKVVPTIIWNVSAGMITSGQNTRGIEVDTTGAGSTPDREVRAEVWIGGYAPQCLLQTSTTVRIIPPATKFVEFGLVDDETLKKYLDAVSAHFSRSRDSIYLIAYAGRNSERGFASDWLERMRETLISSGLSPRRIAAIDGGFREEPHFEFWIVPRRSEPPRPTPTIKQSEIVYPNVRARDKNRVSVTLFETRIRRSRRIRADKKSICFDLAEPLNPRSETGRPLG